MAAEARMAAAAGMTSAGSAADRHEVEAVEELIVRAPGDADGGSRRWWRQWQRWRHWRRSPPYPPLST